METKKQKKSKPSFSSDDEKNSRIAGSLSKDNEGQAAEASKSIVAVIRIAGQVKVKPDIKNTLERLRLRRKYVCILAHKNKDLMGMIDRIKFSVAYGDIDKKTLTELIKMRGENIEGKNKALKINAEEAAEKIIGGKKMTEVELKPFFRLHPPRKGINSKLQYPKGVLGNNKHDINKLIERML